jgi:hypothetical protein
MSDLDIYLLVALTAGPTLWCFMEELWAPFTDNPIGGPVPW